MEHISVLVVNWIFIGMPATVVTMLQHKLFLTVIRAHVGHATCKGVQLGDAKNISVAKSKVIKSNYGHQLFQQCSAIDVTCLLVFRAMLKLDYSQ